MYIYIYMGNYRGLYSTHSKTSHSIISWSPYLKEDRPLTQREIVRHQGKGGPGGRGGRFFCGGEEASYR